MRLPPTDPRPQHWPTTRWSLLGELHSADDAVRRRQAMEKLCAAYNRPVLACLRDFGFQKEDAEDIRQQFFLVVVEGRRLFLRAEAPRGRLRDFLRRSLKRFAANAVRTRRAQKRGGDTEHESLTEDHLRSHLGGTGLSPGELFDREWAHALLDRTWERLDAEYCAKNKAALWQELRPHLERWNGPESQIATAARLGLSPTALSTELNRLRTRFRHILHLLVSETAANPAEAETELQHLRQILCR